MDVLFVFLDPKYQLMIDPVKHGECVICQRVCYHAITPLNNLTECGLFYIHRPICFHDRYLVCHTCKKREKPAACPVCGEKEILNPEPLTKKKTKMKWGWKNN